MMIASILKGRFNLYNHKDEVVIDLDTHSEDFQDQLAAKFYELRVADFMCSSSIDFPEDDGAPAETTFRVIAALETAHDRMLEEAKDVQ